MTDPHYDMIVISKGAGGDTLAYQLAPTGKKNSAAGTGYFSTPRESKLGYR